MTKKQPFLPGFPTTICGRIRRRLQDVIAARRKALLGSSIASYALQFSHILPADFLDELSASKRRRHYCNTNIFWAWLAQILEANASCSKGVSLVQAWCADANLPAPAADTGAYCKARKRIGRAFLRALRGRVNAHLAARVRPDDKYEGLVVKSIDGSSVQLEDTPENQASYPQPSSQKPGCGFPVMGVMGVLNHSHGGWEDFATSTESAHDAPVAHKLLHNFGEGDLACADRAFCTYEIISLLLGAGCSQPHAPAPGPSPRTRLPAREKDRQKPAARGLDETIAAARQESTKRSRLGNSFQRPWRSGSSGSSIRDREGRKRRMVLATTLLDAGRHGWEELAAIYAQRWDIELRLRDVKTTLGMERFKVKTPEMAQKTLEMMIVAYNLVKATCQEAAQEAERRPEDDELQGALDTIVAHKTRYRGRQRQPKKIVEIWREMIAIVSEKLIDLRPGRHEPRAIKRRPKSFSYLTRPRAKFREIPHRGKYRSYA